MDHHKGLSVTAEVEGFEDKYYFGSRPLPLFIPRFRNIKEKRKILSGYHVGGNANRVSPKTDAMMGAELKEALCEPGPWQMSMNAYGECLPYATTVLLWMQTKKITGEDQ
jgi:hypothetical protein